MKVIWRWREEWTGLDAVLFCDFCRAQLLFFFFFWLRMGGRKDFLFMCDAFPSSVYFVRHAAPLPETTTAWITGDIYLSNNYRVWRNKRKRGIDPLEVMDAFQRTRKTKTLFPSCSALAYVESYEAHWIVTIKGPRFTVDILFLRHSRSVLWSTPLSSPWYQCPDRWHRECSDNPLSKVQSGYLDRCCWTCILLDSGTQP